MAYGKILIRMAALRMILGLFLGLAVPLFAHAQQDAAPSYFHLEPVYHVFTDTSANLTLNQALQQSRDWMPVNMGSVNRLYSKHPVWMRFDVDVQTGSALDTYCELASPFLDQVDYYLVQWQLEIPTILDHRQGGDHQDFQQRFQQHRYPLFAQHFPASGQYSIFVRIESASAIMFPFNLQYVDQFYQSDIRSQVFYGIFFGIILVLAYFNLMLLLYVRERTFLHNLFFLLSIGVYEAALSGFGYNYVWFGNSMINDHVLVYSAIASFWFGGSFALRFMELKSRAPRLYRIGSILMGVFLLLVPLAAIESEFVTITFLQGVGLIVGIYALFAIVHQVVSGNQWARYLLLGWSVTISGYCVFILSMLSLFEYGGFALYWQAIGLGFGNVLVTTAIAARVRRERQEKADAMRYTLQLSQEVAQLTREKEQLEHSASQQLQQQVQEKTLELNQMLEYLQNSNRRLEHDSMSDSLTGLSNRRYLDSVFIDTVQQCIKHRTSLGILVIDADHFKKINDNFGHLAGDEVLRKLSTILQKYCRRNLDILVRYGGEEFVMILPSTDIDGVLKVAESIRHHVQYAQFWFDDKKVPVTVSLGAHVCIPPLHATPENLMHKADEALYRAKDNGRNRIEVYKSRYEIVKA